MGFFDWLFGKTPAPAPLSPESLREQLFDAVQSGGTAKLARLCAEHEAAILKHFPSWRTVPEADRRNPSVVQRYGQGLIGVAQHFAMARGLPHLLQLLMGPPGANPLERWRETMQNVKPLMKALEYEKALTLLVPEEERVRELSGGSAESMQAITLAKIAVCHGQSGRPAVALSFFRQALELCRKIGDQEGITTHLGNLFEVLRYLGQGAEAADMAAEYSRALERQGQSGEAQRYKKISDIVRAGEPLNRVVAELKGVLFELDEIPLPFEGRLGFKFCRNRITLVRATALVKSGRTLAEAGRFDEALPMFREASRIDPYAPEPPFNEALTLLHLGRASEAAVCYEKVEALAPGWFQCRADHWLASNIASGRIPAAAFALLRSLEQPSMDASERIRLASRAAQDIPGVPEFHLQLGKDLASLGRELEARQALADGLSQAQEPDIRSRLLVESAMQDPSPEERVRKLREAMAPGGNLIAAASASVMLRMGQGPVLLH